MCTQIPLASLSAVVKLLVMSVKRKNKNSSIVVDSLFIDASIVCWTRVIGICFIMQYLVSFLVLKSSCWGIMSWLLYCNCLPDAL